MEKKLVVCNTYFQLIVAIQLVETIWKKDNVEIIISDQSNNAVTVYSNLTQMNMFGAVYWVENKKLCKPTSNLLNKLIKTKYITLGVSITEITNQKYDELVFYNSDIFTYGLYARLKKNNENLICSRFEEGILSYEDAEFLQNSRLNICNKIRKTMGKSSLDEDTKNFYCFYPEFYKGKLNSMEVPKITDYRSIGGILQKLFNVRPEDLVVKEKYIFFTSVYDFEGGEPIGEFELVQKIAKIVGKDNLIVKTHPRDTRDIFKNAGIHVYNHSEIPWEAIQLNNDFSSKVLMTVNSGSIVGANMMTEKRASAIFLYKCCNYKINPSAVGTSQMIDRFVKEVADENIKSVGSLDEFKLMIGKTD